MTNLISEIGKKVFGRNDAVITSGGIELIKTKKRLLSAVINCYKNQTLIGIFSPVLGEGMFVTGVHDIYDYNEEPIVMLKRYDICGELLIRETLALNEIKAICIFDNAYKHPIIE